MSGVDQVDLGSCPLVAHDAIIAARSDRRAARNRAVRARVSASMRHHLRSTFLALFLLLAGALAVACTPSGSGATTAPSGSVAPAGSVAPPSDGTGKGGYGY